MKRFIVCSIFGLLLTGCAARGPSTVPAQELPDAWQLSGRLALANGRDGGSGTLTWEHAVDGERMRFHGALGRGSWRLDSVGGTARLTLGDGRQFAAPTVEELVRAHTQWDIPVSALAYWVTGQPEPDRPFDAERGFDDRYRLLVQHGWVIELTGYREMAGSVLPRKLEATRDDNEVRLIVTAWEPL